MGYSKSSRVICSEMDHVVAFPNVFGSVGLAPHNEGPVLSSPPKSTESIELAVLGKMINEINKQGRIVHRSGIEKKI